MISKGLIAQKKKILFVIFAFAFLFFEFGLTDTVKAVAGCSAGDMYQNPLGAGYCTISDILSKGTNWILGLASSIILLILIIGGIRYISSSGDEEQIRASKNMITYAIIGLGIILVSLAVVTELVNVLNGP